MSTFVHMELNTTDVDAAKSFYEGVFGWKYQDVPTPDGNTYTMVTAPDGPIGGVQKNPAPGAPPHWLGYVGVDSVQDTIKEVEDRGGKIMMGPIVMPGMGSMAIFTDPQGVAFAVWEAAAPATDSATQAEPAADAAAQTKKAAKKKAAKKKAAKKKAAKKKAAKKKVAKKAAKRAAKKVAKKVAKKAAKKKAAKKKAAKKKATKKRAKKK